MPSHGDTVWLDGDLRPRSAGPIGLGSRPFRYGDGVFATLRCEGGCILAAGRHLARLRTACDRIGLALPPLLDGPRELAAIAAALGCAEAASVLRIQVSAAGDERGFGRTTGRSTTLVEAFPVPPDRTAVVGIQGPGVDLPVAALPDIKTSSAIAHVLAARDAAARHLDDLIRVVDGNITEGVSSNVFWVTERTLFTPTDSLPLYPGVTRALVLEAAEQAGVPVDVGSHGPEALRAADAVFLTNAVRGVEAVGRLEDRTLGPSEITAALSATSLALRRAEGVEIRRNAER